MTISGLDALESMPSSYELYKDKFKDGQNDLITMDSFYKLLVAEMSNQNPLEPTSNTEFISQMASFTALQSQQDANKTAIQNYANSLIGQEVTVNTGDGNTTTGVVSYVRFGESPQVNVNGENYLLSAIAQVHGAPNVQQSASAIGDYGAFAAGILGKTAVVQAQDQNGITVVDEGVVDSIEITDGNVRVVVNGFAYDATDVLRVRETDQIPQATQSTQSAQSAQTTNNVQQTTANTVSQAQAATQTAQQTEIPVAEYTDEDDIEDIYELFE